MKKTELIVKGISCHHCETAIKNAFEDIGIGEVNISPKVRIIEVSHELSEQAVIDCIEELGYEVIK